MAKGTSASKSQNISLIQELRQQGLTTQQIADKTGLSISYINKLAKTEQVPETKVNMVLRHIESERVNEIRICDVAERLNVSPATVCRALKTTCPTAKLTHQMARKLQILNSFQSLVSEVCYNIESLLLFGELHFHLDEKITPVSRREALKLHETSKTISLIIAMSHDAIFYTSNNCNFVICTPTQLIEHAKAVISQMSPFPGPRSLMVLMDDILTSKEQNAVKAAANEADVALLFSPDRCGVDSPFTVISEYLVSKYQENAREDAFWSFCLKHLPSLKSFDMKFHETGIYEHGC